MYDNIHDPLLMIIFTFSKQVLNETLDFCNGSKPHKQQKYE